MQTYLNSLLSYLCCYSTHTPGSQKHIKNVVREFNKRGDGAIGTAVMTKYADSAPRSSMLLFRRKDVNSGIANNHIRNIEYFNANFKKNPSNAVKMYMDAEIFIGKLTRVSDNDSRCYALMEAVLAAFSFSLTHNDDFLRAIGEHDFSLAQVLNISEQKKLSVYIGCDNHELLSTLWQVHAKNPTSFGDSYDCSEREFKVYETAYKMTGSNSLPSRAVAFLNLMNDPATASHGVSLPPSSEDTSRGGELDSKNYKEL
jgi:hypothetical protein